MKTEIEIGKVAKVVGVHITITHGRCHGRFFYRLGDRPVVNYDKGTEVITETIRVPIKQYKAWKKMGLSEGDFLRKVWRMYSKDEASRRDAIQNRLQAFWANLEKNVTYLKGDTE